MAESSRTSLAPHRNFRLRVLTRDKAAGVTHCPLCNVEMDYDVSRKPNSAEPDHIVPHALGGSNETSNGRAICRKCNQTRGGKTTKADTTEAAKPVVASPIW